jgi:2-oxo-4-hydroxy-4-carboxy-5-ureidoimidazoline decarboxylase
MIPQARIEALNALPPEDARAAFLRCCGATNWADAMTAGRPYLDESHLHESAKHCFLSLSQSDWLEAFAHHPRIGDISKLRERFAHSGDLSEREQGTAMAAANEAIITALFEGNQRYEARHGHIFIVCATGKSAAEMKALLEARIDLPTDVELANCASEQQKITALRLQGI